MKQNKVLGIIPARGGSKGVPRKNIRLLCNKPLIVHTIEAAHRSTEISRVIVSTDDQEIAQIARGAGAEVPFIRPQRYATDTASSLSVLQHALAWVREHDNYSPDALAVLPPTSPLRKTADIDGTIRLLWSSGLDSAVTITEVQDHPYFIYNCERDGKLLELMPVEEKPMRRQDLPPYYTHSQAVIATKTSYLDLCKEHDPGINFLSMAGYKIDRNSALDIDSETDFLVAEMLLYRRLEQIRKVA